MAFHEFSSIKVGTCEEGNEPGSAHALEVLLALGNARDKIVGIDECLHKFNFHSQYILGQARCLLFQRGKRLVLTMAPPDQPWTNRPSLVNTPSVLSHGVPVETDGMCVGLGDCEPKRLARGHRAGT